MIKHTLFFMACSVIIACIMLMTSGEFFNRFEHRTISCLNKMIGPFDLIISNPKIGKFITLSLLQNDYLLEIVEISDDITIAENTNEAFRFTINFSKETVLVQKNSKLKGSACQTTNFSM